MALVTVPKCISVHSDKIDGCVEIPFKILTNSRKEETSEGSDTCEKSKNIPHSNVHVSSNEIMISCKTEVVSEGIKICEKSKSIFCDNMYVPSVESAVHIVTNSEKKELSEDTKFHTKSQSFSTVNDFQSFLLPLEQDYRKSSKGYDSQVKTILNKMKQDEYITEENYTTQSKIAMNCYEKDKERKFEAEKFHDNMFLHINFTPNSNTLKSIHSEIESNSQIIQKQLNDKSLNNISSTKVVHHHSLSSDSDNEMFSDDDDSNSDSSGDYSVNDNMFIDDDSDSEASIIFSENCDTEMCQGSSLNFINDYSDSDDDIVFSENYDSKTTVNDLSLKYDFEFDLKSLSGKSSSSKLFVSVTEVSTEGYVNACFKDDDILSKSYHIRSINEKWNNEMKDVSSEPRESKRVSFVPLSNLVSIHEFEPDNDDYSYSLYVLDQLRFKNRIRDFEAIITPYLSPQHRANIFRLNYLCE